MERTPKHIDDIFRERLQEAAPPPPTFVWENVERELRKGRRNRFIWIFALGVAGLAMLGMWLVGSLTNVQDTTVIHTAKTLPSPLTSSLVPTPPEGTEAPQYSNDDNAIKTSNPGIPPSIQKNRSTTPGAIKAVTSGSLPSTVSTKSTLGQNIKPEDHRAKSTADPQLSSTQRNISPSGQAKVWTSLTMLPLPQRLAALSSIPAIPGSDLLKEAWPVAPIAPVAKAKAKKSVKNCYDFARQPSAWLIEGYFGPSLAQRELVASPDDRPYLNKRLKTEKRSLAYNAGLRASLMIKGNLLLRTGLHYDQMTEVFEYIDPAFVRTIVGNVYDPVTGQTTLDTIAVEYGEKYQKTYNRFGMLDIPVMAGVELRKGRSGFNINAGISFNLMFRKRGAILSPQSGEPAWFTPENGTLEVFKPRAGLSATASAQWFYHLKPRLRVFVEPYFKKVLHPVTLRSHPVEQRYGIAGLRFGLTKILD